MKSVLSLGLLFSLLCGCAGTNSLILYNDIFAPLNQDSQLTHSTRFSNQTKDRLVTIGQDIYTPRDKRADPAPENERPYAGYLYADLREFEEIEPGETLLYGIELGIVGPASLARESQCLVHGLMDLYCPYGWDDQLSNEPGFTGRLGTINTSAVDLWIFHGLNTQTVTIEVGNVSTALVVNSEIKWGSGPVYYFAGPVVHLVARDIFLDGNTWQDSASVDKNWIFGELRAGFGFDAGDFNIEYTFAAITPQFKEQDGTYNIGKVGISWKR